MSPFQLFLYVLAFGCGSVVMFFMGLVCYLIWLNVEARIAPVVDDEAEAVNVHQDIRTAVANRLRGRA